MHVNPEMILFDCAIHEYTADFPYNTQHKVHYQSSTLY